MKHCPLWPRSLAGRTLLLLLATALVVYLGGIFAYRLVAQGTAERGRFAQVTYRARSSVDILTDLRPSDRPAAAETLSSPGFRVAWSATPLIEDASVAEPGLSSLRRRLVELAPELADHDVRLRWDDHAISGAHSVLLGAARLSDNSYVTFSAAMIPTAIPSLPSGLLAASFVFLSIIVVAIFLLYTINAPLRRLAEAADSYGRGRRVVLPERGPREIVQVEQAFNALQRRVHRLIADRTQALAAVSHDLRTPITRLRLRCGLIPDNTMQVEIERDLTEMETMIESTLAYLRGNDDVEQPRLTDLVSILTTLVDAAVDEGHEASLSGAPHAVLWVRRVSIKRALANLITNAISYGDCALINLERTSEGVTIAIDDRGPGISETDLPAAFEPFHRLDASRNRGTGGVGLGLTIARQAIEREGGSIGLLNRPDGGLRAEVRLPVRDDPGKGTEAGALT